MASIRYLFLFSLGFGLLGCQGLTDLGELKGSNAQPRFALPLVDTRATIDEFLEAGPDSVELVVDPEGRISLVYRQTVLEEGSEDLFATIVQFLPITVPILSPRQALPFSQPGSIELDRVDLAGGSIAYTFQWSFPRAATVVVRVPQMVRDGRPLAIEHAVPAASEDDPFTVTATLNDDDLAGYSILPEDGSVFIEYDFPGVGPDATLARFLFRVEALDLTYTEGLLANLRYDGPSGIIPIDIYRNWSFGTLLFEDPRAKITVRNSIGFPVRVLVEQFQIISVDGDQVDLEGPPVDEGIDFAYPGPDQVGETVLSAFELNKDNSNLPDILSAKPLLVYYTFDAVTNPGNGGFARGFLTDSSRFRADLELELPLFGRVSDFESRDTVALDFSVYRNIDQAEFTFTSENALPLEVGLQVYFLDVEDGVVDSLFDASTPILRPAPVDEEGVATGVAKETTVATLSGDQFQDLIPATQLALSVRFNSPNGGRPPSVRLLADQGVRVRLAAVLGFNQDD